MRQSPEHHGGRAQAIVAILDRHGPGRQPPTARAIDEIGRLVGGWLRTDRAAQQEEPTPAMDEET